ncbi:MAG TPA: hypothetical protein VFA32_00845 [Dehalococcoidia bacterium]|nr:hypothetical protein [Dehalococcoidia bacterium]
MGPGTLSNVVIRSLQRSYRWLKSPAREGTAESLTKHRGSASPRQTYTIAGQQRSNRAAAADLFPFQETFGMSEGRARTELGSYYTTAVSVYSAVKLRAEAVSRPSIQVFRAAPDGADRR